MLELGEGDEAVPGDKHMKVWGLPYTAHHPRRF